MQHDFKGILTDPLTVSATIAALADFTSQTPGDKENRRDDIFMQLDAYMKRTVLQPLVLSFFAKAYKKDESFVLKLLQDCIGIVTTASASSSSPVTLSALEIFLSTAFVESTATPDRWTIANPFADQFRAALLLRKGMWLAQLFKLGETDLTYFWQKSNMFPGSLRLGELPLRANRNTLPTVTTSFSRLANFLRWMQVRAFAGDNAPLLYQAIDGIAGSSPSDFLDKFAAIYKMDRADVDVLINSGPGLTGALNVAYPAAYQLPLLYLRVVDVLEMQHLVPSPMAVLYDMSTGIRSAASQQDANKVTQVVKAQYDDKQWLTVIRPVNDTLRVERRDALVAWLLANPPAPYQYTWYTANDIFETLMVDVEMMACMATSRLLLAINTIQLWVDRVLLGLERDTSVSAPLPTLTMDKAAVRQWHIWRKRYRIWEANRRIFVYPENWIEPELRDDKTPLFLELEKTLRQVEVTDENVEAAYRTYLERLDELAHLDIVAMYRETAQNYKTFVYNDDVTKRDTIHVFGRTPVHPHIYYYRKRVAEVWTPWEKMDVQVDGDHFVPVMWRGRLRFYWLFFTKDQLTGTAAAMRTKDDYVTPPPVRWKIQLAWTEYKDGRWSAKQMSSEALYSRYILEETPLSKAHVQWYGAQASSRLWNFEGDLDKIRQNYINFFCDYDGDDLRFKLTEKDYSCPTVRLNHLVTMPLASNGLSNYTMNTINAIVQSDDTFMYRNSLAEAFGYFKVQFNGIKALREVNGYQPLRSIYSDPGSLASVDLPHRNYKLRNTDYWYYFDSAWGYSHYPDNDIPLFAQAPSHHQSDDASEWVGETYRYTDYCYQCASIQIPGLPEGSSPQTIPR